MGQESWRIWGISGKLNGRSLSDFTECGRILRWRNSQSFLRKLIGLWRHFLTEKNLSKLWGKRRPINKDWIYWVWSCQYALLKLAVSDALETYQIGAERWGSSVARSLVVRIQVIILEGIWRIKENSAQNRNPKKQQQDLGDGTKRTLKIEVKKILH